MFTFFFVRYNYVYVIMYNKLENLKIFPINVGTLAKTISLSLSKVMFAM